MAYSKKLKLGNLLKFFLDAALLIILILQVYIGGCFLILGYLSLPSEWCERVIIKEYLPEIILKINEIKFFPGGYIALDGVDLKATSINQSLLRADSVEVSVDWSNISELPKVKNLLISEGTIFIPSVYSPEGYQKPLLERMTLCLSLGEVTREKNQFVALHDNICLRGTFETSTQVGPSGNNNFSQKLKSFYTQAANVIEQKEQIDCFESPTITLNARTINHEKQEIDLHISSPVLRHPKIFAKDVELLAGVEIIGLEPTLIKKARLKAQHLEVPDYSLTGDDLFVEIDSDQLNLLESGNWPNIRLAAKNIAIDQFTLNTPVVEIDLGEHPKLAFHGTSGSLGGAADFEGYINTQNKSGSIHALGSLNLIGMVPYKVRERLPKIIFEASPYYQIKLNLNPGFTLGEANIKADVNKLHVDEFTFEHIAASASYKDGIYTIRDLNINRKKQNLYLDFSYDTSSYDYRAALIGSIIPDDYNTLLPPWWASVFRDFDFGQCQNISGDFIIYGNAQSKSTDLYYGRAQAHNISYKDVTLDQIDSIVRGYSGYTELDSLNVTCSPGWVSGDIAFVSKLDKVQAPLSIRLNMQANLILDDAAKLYPKNIAPIISNFETNEPTLFRIESAIFNKEYPAHLDKSFYNLSADCSHKITFKNIPLNNLSFDLLGRSHATYIRDIRFNYAEGEGIGKVDIPKNTAQKNSLRYKFSLRGADQGKALLGLSKIDNIGTNFEVLVDDDRKNLSSGYLNIEIHGEGSQKDSLKHSGYGSLIINNDKLGSVQLLGPLSKILQKTPLNFTTFDLNRMHGDFYYKNEDIYFNPLLIEGPLTRIQSPGRLHLSDLSLDMRVNVSLLANANMRHPQITNFANILTNTLQKPLIFELTGTLLDQRLRSVYDPRNLIPGL